MVKIIKPLELLSKYQEKYPFQILSVIFLITLFLGVNAVNLQTDASFETMYGPKSDHVKIKNLVSFQAMNKYMIMAHDQTELKILGNIVASNKKNQFSDSLENYEEHLRKSFQSEATIKKHSNVIMHIFGYFSNKLMTGKNGNSLFLVD